MPKNEIYRDLYSKELNGLRWNEKKYEVHHIDGNHNHNEIDNLVLLPMALHKRVHMYHRMVTSEEYINNAFSLNPKDTFDGFMFVTMPLTARKFFLAKQEELFFCKLRDFIKESAWAELDFSHDFEKYFKLYSKEMYEKYVEQK